MFYPEIPKLGYSCCMDVSSAFKGKRVTVMGLGLLGRGVGDAEFLAQCGANVLVTDKKTEADLAESVAQLRKYTNIEFRLGGHDQQDFVHAAMVVKAAGVRLDSPEIAAARAAGVQVAMSTALFAKYASVAGAKIIGVTGTRGKSTIAHMIFHVLQRAGRRAYLGGNIRGKSTLALLPEIERGDICVLELDSWQLQGFGDLQISPHISVFTNIMYDHLDYYPNMDAYFSDKANIFRFQKPGDVLLVGAAIADRVRASDPPLDPIVPDAIPKAWKLHILGEHNRENASFVVAALEALGLTDEEIQSGVESFESIEGRLQLVREIHGVKIYNDNNATTPEATIAALEALNYGSPTSIIVIVGGADKGLDMKKLVIEVQKCKKVILIAGTGTDRIKEELPDAKMFDSLREAFSFSVDTSEPGDVILFSPAFASFGMFKNEYDRNDQFMRLVRTMGAAA